VVGRTYIVEGLNTVENPRCACFASNHVVLKMVFVGFMGSYLGHDLGVFYHTVCHMEMVWCGSI
jgi:hypothetical protein